MATSDYLENKILNHVLTNTAYTPPTTVYASLHKSDPTDANTNTEVSTTVDDTAYARQAMAFSTATGTGGSTSNSGTVTFPAVVYGSGAAAYNVTHVGLYDAATNGNLLFYGALAATVNRAVGKTLVFDPASLAVSLT